MPRQDKAKNQENGQIAKLPGTARRDASCRNTVSTDAGDAHGERAERLQWIQLLQEALNEPGLIHAAYSVFHNYSLGNQLAAAFQCRRRGLPLGPINTFNGWKSLGRHVNKGEKALELCVPFIGKASTTTKNDEENAGQGRAGAGQPEHGGRKRKSSAGPSVTEAVEGHFGER